MELQVTNPSYELINKDSMLQLSNELSKLIKEKGLSSNIQGKQFVNVEGWQFAGASLGLMPIITETTDLTRRGTEPGQVEIKYMAKCEVRNINTGQVVATGIALCSNFERTKKGFDEYAILSMAQTRAIGKAYRNLLAWLMKAAGFEATPAEEMDFAVAEEPKKPTKKPVVEVEAVEFESDIDRALVMGEIGKATKVKQLTDIYFAYKQFIDGDPALIELLKLKKESIK
jgi:hypothetical protein